MKKLIVLSVICAAGIIGCGKKIMPESAANNQTRPANDKEVKATTQQPATNASATSTPSFNNMRGTESGIPILPASEIMDKGKTVYVTKCGSCHALKAPGDYSRDQMKNILKTEIPKAKLDNKEADQLTVYLMANTRL